MKDEKSKRVFAGYYQRYDHAYIYVLLVVDDIDTGEKIVLFKYTGKYADGKNHAMTFRSFCEYVEVDGEACPKFRKCTHKPTDQDRRTYLKNAGFNVPRLHQKENPYSTSPFGREAKTYENYALYLCSRYNDDLNRYRLTIKKKRWVGVTGKREFEAVKEDLIFLNDCLKVELKEYRPIFKRLYIKKLSIRKCAEDLGRNRGSIEYAKKKMLKKLAELLELRDKKDNISRLDQHYR